MLGSGGVVASLGRSGSWELLLHLPCVLGFSLSAFLPFPVHLLGPLSLTPLTCHFYSLYNYLICAHSFPSPVLAQILVVPPMATNGSFPLSIFALSPEQPNGCLPDHRLLGAP